MRQVNTIFNVIILSWKRNDILHFSLYMTSYNFFLILSGNKSLNWQNCSWPAIRSWWTLKLEQWRDFLKYVAARIFPFWVNLQWLQRQSVSLVCYQMRRQQSFPISEGPLLLRFHPLNTYRRYLSRWIYTWRTLEKEKKSFDICVFHWCVDKNHNYIVIVLITTYNNM